MQPPGGFPKGFQCDDTTFPQQDVRRASYLQVASKTFCQVPHFRDLLVETYKGLDRVWREQ
jgi:hypothetical protein